MRNLLEFEYSAWYIVLCVALGIVYAYLQYDKAAPWSSRTNQILAASRGVLVLIVAVLMLGPLVRAIQNYREEPVLVVAVDNSESVRYTTDSVARDAYLSKLKELADRLSSKGWQVQFQDLAHSAVMPDSIRFDQTRTNLTGMIRTIQQENEGTNLGAILLVSDGIFNSGFSPDLISAYSPIYTLGVGDTVPKADLSLIDLKYSKTVYQENKFPISIKIKNERIGPVNAVLRLYRGTSVIETRTVPVSPNVRLSEQEFIIEADEPGKQRYSIQLQAVTGEATTINNTVTAYVDVIEGRQKILLVADAPTPDIRALRLALTANDQFEVLVAINEAIPKDKFDLIIYAHTPGKNSRLLPDAVTPKLYLVGEAMNKAHLAAENILQIGNQSNRFDRVTSTYNADFTAFTLENDMVDWLANVPPMMVPFGEISMPVNARIILYQKIGSVQTGKPLAYIIDTEPKAGVIIGDGLWKWRLDEYRRYGTTARFDELITKISKYLASRPDNRQFKLYPIKDSFEEGEEIVFRSETYNELFEPLFGEIIHLRVMGNAQTYTYDFTPVAGNTQIIIDQLPEGLYTYDAYTEINNKRLQVTGQFSIAKPDLEAAELTADHILLRRLATDSGGNFYNASQMDELIIDLAQLDTPAIIHSQEKEFLLLNLFWVGAMLLTLATVEWLSRKMLGGY